MGNKIKILVIHGPNLNLLGIREPEIYGKLNLKEINATLQSHAQKAGVEIYFFQSNHEGDIVDRIQEVMGNVEGILINPAAYTHTSVAIRDAIKAVGIPTVEVHLSDISKREEFRKFSYIKDVAVAQFSGEGLNSYTKGLDFLIQYINQIREKSH